MSFEPDTYGPAAAPLLVDIAPSDLGPDQPETARRDALARLTPESLVAPRSLADREMALAAISGLWLRHNFLDASHRLSQDIPSATGSFWHGIMHRREPDYGNSKYWFHRVGTHPIFPALCTAARQLAERAGAVPDAAYLASQSAWDPFAFVDLCQRGARGPHELRSLCIDIQQREWELLFDYSFRQALDDRGE